MRRNAAVFMALIAVLVAGAGCSSAVVERAAPAEEPAEERTAALPEVGDCWTNSTPGVGSPLDDTEEVACSGSHQAETVRVDEYAFDPRMPYPTLADLSATDATLQMSLGVCTPQAAPAYLGERVPSYGLYVTTTQRLPSPEEWAAGARWLRCDLLYGIPPGGPPPGTMAGALVGTQSAAYHLCFTGTSETFLFVRCTQQHDAEALGQPYQLPPLTPWPADGAARQVLRDSCADQLVNAFGAAGPPAGVTVDVFVGTEYEWESWRFVACVLVPSGGGSSTTTLLH